MDLKFFIKQRLKEFVQNRYLPSVYDKYRKVTKVEPKKVIFADSHSESLSENMKPVALALKKRGYKVGVMCRDIDKMTIFGRLSFMRAFMKEYASAGTVCIGSYFLPVSSCEKRPETTVIQLWHSGGLLKKMGYDTQEDIPKGYRGEVTKNYDLVTVSAPCCEPVWDVAWHLPAGTASAMGLPRTDKLYDKRWRERMRKKVFEKYNDALSKKILVYAPSFSGNAANAESKALEENVMKYFESVSDEWLVLTCIHPRLMKRYKELDCGIPAEELIPAADLLVTDYSSVLFDYLVMRKPFMLYCPDYDSFKKKRGFYRDPIDFPCYLVKSGEELCVRLRDGSWNDHSDELEAFFMENMKMCDGMATQRVVDYLEKRLR